MEQQVTDYKSWVWALSVLLDKIDMATDDDEIGDLCRQRFDIAEDHGAIVTFEGPTSAASH